MMRTNAGESARLNTALQEMMERYELLSQQKHELLNRTADEDSPLFDAVVCVSALKAAVGYGKHVIGLAAGVFEQSTQENTTWLEWSNLTGYSAGVVRNARLIPFRVIQLLDHAQQKIAVYSRLPDFEAITLLLSSICTQARKSQLYALCNTLDQHYRANIDNPTVGSHRPDMDIRYETLYAIANHVLALYQPLYNLIRLLIVANETLMRELPNPVVRLPYSNLPS